MFDLVRLGIILGCLMTFAGMVSTAIGWRRLHRAGERPGGAFLLWFVACCLSTTTLPLMWWSYLEEPAFAHWGSMARGALVTGSTWWFLVGFREQLFVPRKLPTSPTEPPQLPPD